MSSYEANNAIEIQNLKACVLMLVNMLRSEKRYEQVLGLIEAILTDDDNSVSGSKNK